MTQERRRFTAEFKAGVVRAALSGDETPARLADGSDVCPSLFEERKWMYRSILLWVCIFYMSCSNLCFASSTSYTEKVVQHLNTLLTYGTDHYGPTSTPLFMAVIDDDTLTAPSDPNYARYLNRVTDEQRALRGANLWWQGDLIRLLCKMSSHNASFSAAADAHITYYLDNFSNYTQYGNNNMIKWGDHLFYDAFSDMIAAPVKPEHQITVSYINHMSLWDQMWRLAPSTAAREIEEIWRMHIYDDRSGKWDRHARDREHWAVGFSGAGSSFIKAFAFMYEKTGNPEWKSRAELLRDHMWNRRNTDTNIIPTVANTCRERGEDFYLRHYADRSAVGMWVPMLAYGYKTFDDIKWLNQVEAIAEGWLRYAYDKNQKAFYKFIRIDGVYDAANPDVETGHSYFWRNESNYRNNSSIGLGLLDAYEISHKSFLLDGAKLIGDELLTTEPHSDSTAGGYHGSFGEYYAAAINILMRLHRITNDQRYLDRAVYMADHGITWLWNDTTKIFRGHYYHGYEIGDGTDKFCEALVDLDSYSERRATGLWNDEFKEDCLLTGRWSEYYDEHTSCWVNTLGAGKLVIRDDNPNGGMFIKRNFPKAANGQYLKITFEADITRTNGAPIVIAVNDDAEANAVKISAEQAEGLLQWTADNGQLNLTGIECSAGRTYKFELIFRGTKVSILINGQPVLENSMINNNLLSQNLSQIKLSTVPQSTVNIEFKSMNVNHLTKAPNTVWLAGSPADLARSGKVNLMDFVIFAENWAQKL